MKKLTDLFEVVANSNHLFGGSSLKIPGDGAHKGQEGWQSNNAWDIKASIGTPVYAVVGGTLKTYSDYGAKPIRINGKTLFGGSFTVKSDGGLPDVYYTHLKNVTVRQGSRVECGQLLGYVMDFPGSDYDHLHIGVKTGHVRQFLNDDGTLKCAKGKITNTNDNLDLKINNSKLEDDLDLENKLFTVDDLLKKMMAPTINKLLGIKESKKEKILENIQKIKKLL
jgi:murein DD-endopeptidase MepM/ murein hydrolase activator NlpD